MPEENNLKEESFVLAYGFRGLVHGWLSLLFRPEVKQNTMAEEWREGAAQLIIARTV